jgi:hypothetical protein
MSASRINCKKVHHSRNNSMAKKVTYLLEAGSRTSCSRSSNTAHWHRVGRIRFSRRHITVACRLQQEHATHDSGKHSSNSHRVCWLDHSLKGTSGQAIHSSLPKFIVSMRLFSVRKLRSARRPDSAGLGCHTVTAHHTRAC